MKRSFDDEEVNDDDDEDDGRYSIVPRRKMVDATIIPKRIDLWKEEEEDDP